MAYTAAALYALAGVGGVLDRVTPGPRFSVIPSVLALALAAIVAVVGPRLTPIGLAPLGPLGVGFLAYALVSSPDVGDTAALFALPVLWTSVFFRRRGALAIIALTGLAYALALLSLPPSSDLVDHWLDVMVAVSAVAAVVTVLGRHNDQLLAQVADEARTDTLTGLLNRRGFDERATIELAHARRDATAVAVAVFDLDYFKRVNDEWGHDIGDRVLERVGAALMSHSRAVDVVARIGGEEFLALLPGASGADADAFTQRIRKVLLRKDAVELPTIGVSAGVAAGIAPMDLQTLLQQADSALYAAKRGGRGHTRISAESSPLVTGVLPSRRDGAVLGAASKPEPQVM